MYHWIDSRNFPGSKNLQALNLISKTSHHLLRGRFELNHFNRLPVIKEEGGTTDDEELEQNILRSVFQKHYRSKKRNHMKDSLNDVKNLERIIASKSVTKLPPLASINCLLDNHNKQAEQIWAAQCGKCILRRKSSKNVNLSELRVTPIESKKYNDESGDFRPPKFFPSRRSVQERNVRNIAVEKAGFSQTRLNRKKPTKVCLKEKSLRKKASREKSETEKVLERSLSVSSFADSQQLVAERIHNFIDSHSNDSQESFVNVEQMFYRDKKHQEAKKEVCALCEKVFYDTEEYIQHLVTHEAVDKFSCKICKIHFLSMRKYKQHCKDFHFTSLNNIKNQNLEYEKKWLTKFECKRCKVLFETEQNYEVHRRIHAEKDLVEKYLLGGKNA